jgi:hypothetical protein
MSDRLAKNLQPLSGVHGGTSETLSAHAHAVYGASAPSIRIESAEGITTYPGLNGDEESEAARKYISGRVAEIDAADKAATTDQASAETTGAGDRPAEKL